jgi:hypothetical protein
MNFKKISVTASVLLVCLIIFSFTSTGGRYTALIKNLEVYAELFKTLNDNYVDDLNPNDLMRTGIDGMLNSMDPYTNYFPEDQVEDIRTMTTGQYGGIGISTMFSGKIISLAKICVSKSTRPSIFTSKLDGKSFAIASISTSCITFNKIPPRFFSAGETPTNSN